MIRLADIFSSGMTLQRQKEIAIWGETSQQQQIQVYLDEKPMTQSVFPAGNFRIMLPAQEAGENHVIKVVGSSGDVLQMNHIDIGEVWVAGGQSNMEFQMCFEQHYSDEVSKANDPHLRFYDVPKYAFAGEEKDGFKNQLGYGLWRTCNRDELKYFSAVGYFFGKQLREKLHVPIAIVGCNWGGTTASTWLDEEILKNDSDLMVYWHAYQDGLKTINLATYAEENRKARAIEGSAVYLWMMQRLIKGNAGPLIRHVVNKSTSKPQAPDGPHSPNRPGGLYHAMVKKIMGFSCRGVLWYQGESDESRAQIYARLFTKVIDCWRAGWQDELPFLFVQLAPFGSWFATNGKNFPIIRAQQELVGKSVAKTAMASIMDIGMEMDIHPKNKKAVGERLALLARGKVYGEQILCESPEAVQVMSQDDIIEIRLTNAGSGLQVKGNSVNAIQVLSGEKECKISQIMTKADRLLLRSEDFIQADQLVVHFADVDYCEVNLFNSIGLPAKPFVMRVSDSDNII